MRKRVSGEKKLPLIGVSIRQRHGVSNTAASASLISATMVSQYGSAMVSLYGSAMVSLYGSAMVSLISVVDVRPPAVQDRNIICG